MNEIPLYDWAEGDRGRLLIYSGRKPNGKIDTGVVYSPEVLRILLERNKLTGQALKDAKLQLH